MTAVEWDLAPEGQRDGPFAHLALLYRDTQEYTASCVPFVVDGLESGERVAVAVPTPHLSLLRDALASCSPDLVDQVRWVDMTEAGRNPGRILPAVLHPFASAAWSGSRRVRIVGEPVWPGRSAEEYPACVQHEALINSAFHRRPATILCPYDLSNLDTTAISDASLTHPMLASVDGTFRSTRFSPERAMSAYNRPLRHAVAAAEIMTVRAENVPEARHTALAHARQVGLADHRLADVALVVTELVTNGVEHGGGQATLRLWAARTHLVCEVLSSGRLSDPLAGRVPTSVHQTRGRGLLLVNHSADLVRTHVSESGTTVRAYFRR